MTARGFVLLEWLIASALVLLVSGAAFMLVVPVRDVVERTQQRTDMALSARVALELIAADIREAGSPAAVADAGADPPIAVPLFMLTESLDSAVPVLDGSAVEIHQVPLNGPQGRLAAEVFSGDTLLQLATEQRCARGEPGCGFAAGDHALLFTAEAAALVTIGVVHVSAVTVDAPLTQGFGADAVLCKAVTSTYGLRDGPSSSRLVRLSDGGAEQPVLDHVVGFEISADALWPATTGVSIRLRIQVAAAALRGPAGYLFAQAGVASGPRRWVPDIELRTVVALRNRWRE